MLLVCIDYWTTILDGILYYLELETLHLNIISNHPIDHNWDRGNYYIGKYIDDLDWELQKQFLISTV